MAKLTVRRLAIVTGLTVALLCVSVAAVRGQDTECAPAVRDEFLRQQSIVQWTVYCPSFLPEDVRMDRVDGGTDPGGGLFAVTLASPSGTEIVITQGAGASVFARHTPEGPPEEPAGEAQFGDLAGKLYAAEPAAVIAFDDDNFGHAVQGTGITLDVLVRIAASMKPVGETEPQPPVLPAAGMGSGGSARAPYVIVGAFALLGGLLILAGLSWRIIQTHRLS